MVKKIHVNKKEWHLSVVKLSWYMLNSILVTDVLIEKLIQILTQYNKISWIIFAPSSQMLPRIILIKEDTLICLAY